MFKGTKAEYIASLIAKNAEEKEIKHMKSLSEKELIELGIIAGKENDVVSVDANVTSKSAASKNGGSNSEDISSGYETPEYLKPQLIFPPDKEEVSEEDPYESFYIKPEFFGVLNIAKDGTNLGVSNRPSEEEAAKELNEKLSGLGVKVVEDRPGVNAIKIITPEGEEDINLGLWEKFWTMDNETPTEKAERLNGIIKEVIDYRTQENPLFDIDTYVNAMQDAKNDAPEVYSYSEDGGRFLSVDELNYEQLSDHTHRVHLNLMNKYWDSNEGKKNLQTISKQRKEQQQILWNEAVDKIQAGFGLDKVVKEYHAKLENQYSEILKNNGSYQQMVTNTTAVVGSLFNDRLAEARYKAGMKEEFGGFIASSDILGAFAKGATVIFPKEIQEFTAMQKGNKIRALKEKLSALDGLDPESYAKGYHFSMKGGFDYKAGQTGTNFPLGNYKVSELRQKYLKAIVFEEMSMIDNLLKADQYKEVLSKIEKPNSALYTADGRLNITSDNWQYAVGDQAFRMLSSIFSLGMTTLVSEASGAYSQILETNAAKKAKAAGLDWASMSKEDKMTYMLDIIDSGEDGYNEAMAVGGVNAALDAASNFFFVSKFAKFIPSNMKAHFALFMKGKFKAALKGISKNANVGNAVDILQTTGLEMLTEGLQEEVTQIGVGVATDDYSHSWNPTLNAMLTAAVTTPFLGGGAKATSAVYSEVSSRIAAIKNPKGIIAYCRKQKQQYAFDNALPKSDPNYISDEKYEELMIQIHAAEKMFTETDKIVTDTKAVEMILEAQVEIEKQLVKVRDLNKDIENAKKENPNYNEEIDGVETRAELQIVLDKIKEQNIIKGKAKRKDAYKSGTRDKAKQINEDPIKSKDFDAKCFSTNQELINTLESDYGITVEQFQSLRIFAGGKGNGFTITKEEIQKIIPGYEGKGVVFWSDEAIIKNIDEGDRWAGNSDVHEALHVDMYYKSDEELVNAQNAVLTILNDSKSPQMQEIRRLLGDRLRDYEKEFGKDYLKTRAGIEEFFAAISDATSVLATDALTKEDRVAILQIGEELLGMMDGYVDINVDNTVEFLQNLPGGSLAVNRETYFDSNGNIVESIDVDGDVTERVSNSLKDGKVSDLILIEESNPYPKGRTSGEGGQIDTENKRLYELIKKHETYVDPNGDLEMQARVRAGGKKYRDLLLYNNYGAFMDRVLRKYDDTKPGHSDERKEFFVGESMVEFVKALQTYNRKKDPETGEYVFEDKSNSFSAYYFFTPTQQGHESVAAARLARIWDEMQMDFKKDISDVIPGNIDPDQTTEDMISDYNQDYVLDIETKLNDFSERSELRQKLAEIMEFEVDGKNYKVWIKKQSDLMKQFDFSEIYGPNATQDMKKMGQALWKNFQEIVKTGGKLNKNGEPTQYYKDFLEETIETFYKNINQKTFNKIFPEYVDTEGRATVDQSKELKGKGKPKDPKAGNILGTKMEFTDEVKQEILNKLLRTDQIEELKNTVLYDKESFTEFQKREVQVTLTSGKIHKGKVKISGKNLILITSKKDPKTKKPIEVKISWNDIQRGKLTSAGIHSIVRIDMVQESTLKHFSEMLFDDAAMQIVTSEEFKKENGVAQSEILQTALLLDKGQDVKFSLPDGGEQTLSAETLNSEVFAQETSRLIQLVENYEDSNNWEDVISVIQNDPTASQEIKDWVSSMYDKGLVESAGEKRFKSFAINYLKSTGQNKLANEFQKGGNIRFNKKAKDNMVKNAAVFSKIFGKEFMTSVGFEWLGFKSGNRYLNTTQGLRGSVRGEHRDNYESLVNDLQSTPEENLPGNLTYEDLANVRMMNKMSGTKDTGIFKRIIALNKRIADGEITKKEAQKIIEDTGLQAEIDAANKANEKVLKTIIKEIITQTHDGNVDEVAILEMFKMQSNLVEGLRGLSRVDAYLLLSGKMSKEKFDAINWKGEHLKPMSVVSSEIMELMQRYKADSSIDLDSEIDLILADYTQILGDSKTFDTLDVPGKANVAGVNRLAYMSDKELRGLTNASGFTARQIQAELLKRKSTKQAVINSKKESQAVENINLKNTATGNIQGASVMDFDLTVGVSENYVIARKDGQTRRLSATDWPTLGEKMKNEGWEMDFSNFNKVTKGKRGPLFDKLKNQIEKYGVTNVHILTARAAESAPAIQAWLASEGINLPLENIVGLGNSTGEAKADWIEQNLVWNGFNDIYFVDDHHENVDAVQTMFDKYPPGLLVDGGKSVIVNPFEYNEDGGKLSLSDTFNKVLEDTEGIKAEATFSKAQGEIRGRNAGSILDIVYPPSAYDFEMFTYKYIGKGQLGENQQLFFKEKLFDPYEQAIQQIDKKKQVIRNDYKALVKELPQVKKNLKQNIEGTNYTIEQAVRVYTWTKNGMEIPGLSKRDQKALIKVVEADPQLIEFSDKLSALSRSKDGYVKPSEYWTVETIAYDLTEMVGKAGRAEALSIWKENVDQIFSEENKNKLRALYGNHHVEALEDMLYRMEYGRNRGKPGRIEQQWNNWVNNSVGAVMFFNMRSASLQTISAFNYIDWENNNMAKAALAFANQPQYWKDFGYIFNSDYLKERRAGSKRTINEAELAAHLKGKDNKAKAALAWLLEKGFTPTQIADSFAIASGGAGFYRNQVKFYEKQGMTTEDAEAQAFLDFRDKTEKGQQSSRADMISQQQAGGLGRLILAFKNTPMQYNRLMIKSIADLKNGRGSAKTNLSKIAYYGAVQNAIFTSLQTALFSALGDEDQWDTKKERVANGMIDSILNGMGLTGAVAVTIKNGYLSYSKHKKRGFRGDQTRTIIEFANMSPTIGSKLRKLYTGIKGEQLNQGAIEEMGFNINNPAFNSLANVISATTNIPVDRAVNKIQNILLASKSETEAADKIALLLGWNPWDLGIEQESRIINKEVKEKKKIEKKKKKKEEEKIKKVEEEKKKIETNKEKQKEQKKKGEQVTCLKCNRAVVKGKTLCTVHEEKEQRKDGKKVRCSLIYPKGHKKSGKQCGEMTTNKSGLCPYHD